MCVIENFAFLAKLDIEDDRVENTDKHKVNEILRKP